MFMVKPLKKLAMASSISFSEQSLKSLVVALPFVLSDCLPAWSLFAIMLDWVDPNHVTQFCVLLVLDRIGISYRLKLKFYLEYNLAPWDFPIDEFFKNIIVAKYLYKTNIKPLITNILITQCHYVASPSP